MWRCLGEHWQEAMDRFGSDKPDTRFGMELCDVTDVVRNCGFQCVPERLKTAAVLVESMLKGQGHMPRKE